MDRLSLLVLGHCGKLRKLEVDFEDHYFILQLLCLRLAKNALDIKAVWCLKHLW